MLVGYVVDQDIIVRAQIEGGPKAIRERSRFVPDGEWQQERLEEIYASSGRITTYLGDWHSHPLGRPRPSGRDKRTARDVAGSRAARTPHPVTLIVGRPWRHHRWEAQAHYLMRGNFERMEIRRYQTE
jgi:integrative and conjugative element protein (TIGR02256 family)